MYYNTTPNETPLKLNYDKQSWSSRVSRLKHFARCGLIEYSEHALEQMKVRKITKTNIMQVLNAYNTHIVQCHAKGVYNENKDELMVILGKTTIGGKKKPLHIVVAEHINEYGGIHYKVVTSYVPSSNVFVDNGRFIYL